MNKFRLMTRLFFGFMLFVMPLFLFHAEPGHGSKVLALKCLVVSLIGLMLIILTLWSEHFSRNAKRLQDEIN